MADAQTPGSSGSSYSEATTVPVTLTVSPPTYTLTYSDLITDVETVTYTGLTRTYTNVVPATTLTLTSGTHLRKLMKSFDSVRISY